MVVSKLVSPGQVGDPSLSNVLFGPEAFVTSPVLNTTPLCIGKFGFVF